MVINPILSQSLVNLFLHPCWFCYILMVYLTTAQNCKVFKLLLMTIIFNNYSSSANGLWVTYLKTFNVCSKWSVCLSTCVTFVSANFYISLYICWKKIIFKIINTRHFDTSNYITNRRSPSSKSNKWTITNSVISLIFGISILGWKNKNCVTKTLFTNFTRRNCFPKYGRIGSLFVR